MALSEYKTKKTRNWQKLGDKIPCKTYVALLNQVGSNAPTAKVLYNDLGQITFEYVTTGEYRIKSNGLFVEDKTFVLSQTTFDNSPASITYYISRSDANTLSLKVLEGGNNYIDGFLSNSPLEIRVYN